MHENRVLRLQKRYLIVLILSCHHYVDALVAIRKLLQAAYPDRLTQIQPVT